MKHLSDFPLFAENQFTLQKASEDTSKTPPVCMVSSKRNAVDFDTVKTRYTSCLRLRNHSAASIDAMYEYEDAIVFVEFKNGNKSVNRNINDKLRDSLLIYCDITKSTISDTRTDVIFVLVLNDQKIKEKTKIHMNVAQRSENTQYDFVKYKGIYFSDVCIITADEFEERFC